VCANYLFLVPVLRVVLSWQHFIHVSSLVGISRSGSYGSICFSDSKRAVASSCIIVHIYNVSGFVFPYLVLEITVGGTKGSLILDVQEQVKNPLLMIRDGCPTTLRFRDVVNGLAASLHPLLGFDQGPCLDTGVWLVV